MAAKSLDGWRQWRRTVSDIPALAALAHIEAHLDLNLYVFVLRTTVQKPYLDPLPIVLLHAACRYAACLPQRATSEHAALVEYFQVQQFCARAHWKNEFVLVRPDGR
jgi:hypothetical protein